MSVSRNIALAAKAWPFEEARKLLKRYESKAPEKGYVLFETGYGPSGLPHIGTFGEVARTTMVRRAFETMSDIPTKLFCFSDDMDGLRKVPDNVPNKDLIRANLGMPLTKVPDPFGTHPSFGEHNNARLRAFLDSYGFEYEFKSATQMYQSGAFDKTLLMYLAHYDKLMDIMLPTLGEERRQTYSPFMPICPRTGHVLQVGIVGHDVQAGTVSYKDPETGDLVTVPVTGGHCKLQWKADWSMRWVALGVDYEMAGKDLISSVEQSSKIARAVGSNPPEGFNYELFLDQNGEKISKSKGNGLTMEDWLKYAPDESLALFMYQQPRRAKRLYFDVIPKAVDEYITFLTKFPEEPVEKQVENPVWHIHGGKPPRTSVPLSFAILLNLASVISAESDDVLWGFISRYAPGTSKETSPLLARLVGYALVYFQDFVKPTKKYRAATDLDRAALLDLKAELEKVADDATHEDFQNAVYEVGKRHPYGELRDWFKAIYEVMLGQEQGPRMGSFIALYGRKETIKLIDEALAGKLLAA
ncbi:lysine--tRNA ligase [Lacibacterium aquatile]|uniref:Lysine--tRNA ligase n=1 Tax=Lacibacterium aquatile TaxID=1168082 RepID=A0ABW5DVC7_9PROT